MHSKSSRNFDQMHQRCRKTHLIPCYDNSWSNNVRRRNFPLRDVIVERKKWVDKTRLDNRIYQKRIDVSSTRERGGIRKYGGDQQIPAAIIILLAGVFSPRGNCPREIGKAFVGGADSKNRGRSIILRSFPVAANLARARTLSGLSDRPLDRWRLREERKKWKKLTRGRQAGVDPFSCFRDRLARASTAPNFDSRQAESLIEWS